MLTYHNCICRHPGYKRKGELGELWAKEMMKDPPLVSLRDIPFIWPLIEYIKILVLLVCCPVVWAHLGMVYWYYRLSLPPVLPQDEEEQVNELPNDDNGQE